MGDDWNDARRDGDFEISGAFGDFIEAEGSDIDRFHVRKPFGSWLRQIGEAIACDGGSMFTVLFSSVSSNDSVSIGRYLSA